MAKKIYVVGNEAHIIVRAFIKKLESPEYDIQVYYPTPESLFFPNEDTIHLILCLSPEVNYGMLSSLASLQQRKNMYIYTVGSTSFSIEEEKIFSKLPSFRFSNYNLDVNRLKSLIERNDAIRKRILIVDDEAVMLRSIKGWLKDDFEVSAVNSGEMALEFLSSQPVDLVLLDYKMPEMDGSFVLAKIRQDNRLHDLPVIFLTANADKDTILSVAKLKPQGYILKSKSPEEIKQSVVDFFKNRIETIQ